MTALEDRCTPAAIAGLDLSFGTNGVATLGPANTLFEDIVAIPGGKFVAVGGAGGQFVVAQFLSDGTPDSSFGGGDGIVTSQFGAGIASEANAVTIGQNGDIIIAGSAAGDAGIARLSANGNIAVSKVFNTNEEYQGVAFSDLANKVYAVRNAGGDFRIQSFSYNDLNPNGFQDINISGVDAPTDLTIDRSGQTLYAVGSADAGANFAVVSVAATLLTAFDTKVYDFGGALEIATAATFSSVTGDLIVAGISNKNGTTDVAVFRVNSNNIDQQIGNVGYIVTANQDGALGVVSDQFDRIIVVGQDATAGKPLVARFNADQTPDTSFTAGGLKVYTAGASTTAESVAINTADGKITVVGDASTAFKVQNTIGRPNNVVATGSTNPPAVVFQLDPNDLSGLDANPITPPGVPPAPVFVRIAQADVNGDGVLDVVAATGPGAPATVVVADGTDGTVLAQFTPFGDGFTGGMWVAAGDFTGDGRAEIVVSLGVGVEVRVFEAGEVLANPGNPAPYHVFNPLIDDQGVPQTTNLDQIQGIRLAVGDVNGDGIPELAIAAGLGGAGRVVIHDGLTIRNMTAGAGTVPLANFFGFEESQRDGAFVAIGDFNGDGLGDVVLGGGPNGGLRIRIVDGQAIVDQGIGFDLAQMGEDPDQLNNFFVDGDQTSRAGIRVGTFDVDGDNLADLAVGSGDNTNSFVKTYTGKTLADFRAGVAATDPPADQTLDPMFGVLVNGVFVG